MVPKSRLQRLLSELYGFINKTQNPLIVQVGLFSRIAIAYAMTGQLAKAEDYIEKAFASSIYIPKCTELEFMFHMYIMILLSKYQEDPTESFCALLNADFEIFKMKQMNRRDIFGCG
jgi:hypothetical protein